MTKPITMMMMTLCILRTSSATNMAAGTVKLHILPHTHADVGWLETVDALSRMNVSRILDGVTGNLMNDTKKRRRFIWDEMAFLQLWWDQQATPAQKEGFKQLVAEKRIEFVDNGWSQHDMGCTTSDSMLSNWLEGHQWLLNTFGETSQPKIGWSIDPFGQSSSQAVMQSLMGMDAWFFTRVNDVDKMKADKTIEYVWRGSSAIPSERSEIFTHVFESYYCMPLPTYAFEWGPSKGAAVPDAAHIHGLAEGLAKIAQKRSAWFRTANVLIPWGCDYQYQNAALVFDATDQLIDIINANPAWGVHAQYSTPSEYLDELLHDAHENNVTFPVKSNGTSNFPFGDWSGYFTSRPSLKGNSQKAVNQLEAAEAIFAINPPKKANASRLWNGLELARRNNGIVQHHDAITGTGCSNPEGCSGNNQLVGPHDVIGDYQHMLHQSMAATADVMATLLGESTGAPPGSMSTDVSDLGKILMGAGDGGDAALVTVFNPLGHTRTEVVSVQVPVCAVSVTDAEGKSVVSQVTASIGIGDGQPPFYDFELHFMAKDIPPLGYLQFRLHSAGVDAACGGGDRNAFVKHKHMTEPESPSANQTARIFAEAKRRLGDACGDVQRWHELVAQVTAEFHPTHPTANVTIENEFMRVHVETPEGITGVFDKTTGRYFPLTHKLMQYSLKQELGGPGEAYTSDPKGPAVPATSSNAPGDSAPPILAATVALGPVIQEVRLQVTDEHKTRIRLWVSDDPAVGQRIELAHRIGVLKPNTEILSRFTLGGSAATLGGGPANIENMTLWSEDNGYEKIPHIPGTGADKIAFNMFPSQMSVLLANTSTMFGVALDRSHAVGSLYEGTLDIVHHRRASPYFGTGETVVLDDADRIFTQTWLSLLGDRDHSNRMRVTNRQRLNHPLVLAFRRVPLETEKFPHNGEIGAYSLPESIHLQTARVLQPNGTALLLRLQHLYTDGEDAALSVPVTLSIKALLGLVQWPSSSTVEEVTIDGMRAIDTVNSRRHFPTDSPPVSRPPTAVQSGDTIVVHPFEIRAFKITK